MSVPRGVFLVPCSFWGWVGTPGNRNILGLDGYTRRGGGYTRVYPLEGTSRGGVGIFDRYTPTKGIPHRRLTSSGDHRSTAKIYVQRLMTSSCGANCVFHAFCAETTWEYYEIASFAYICVSHSVLSHCCTEV